MVVGVEGRELHAVLVQRQELLVEDDAAVVGKLDDRTHHAQRQLFLGAHPLEKTGHGVDVESLRGVSCQAESDKRGR